MRKATAGLTLIAFLLFLSGCATTGGFRVEPPPGARNFDNLARIFPQLLLITTSGDPHQGKLTQIEGEEVVLRPFPYWNVEEVRIPVEEIRSIEIQPEKNGAAAGAANGAGWTFLIFGAIGLGSKYNTQFQSALLGSGLMAAVAGLAGLAIGALTDAAKRTQYDFYKMTPPEKEAALKKIMGRTGI
jgi:hypothetical protein